jgi:hypothetical protein
LSFSVVIGDLDIERIAVVEAKADTPLVVDPDRMLTSAVASQSFRLGHGARWPDVSTPASIPLCGVDCGDG